MANYAILKALVEEIVKTNGNEEITGANLQSTLLSIINSLGTGYQFAGIATPSTVPVASDENVFYIAYKSGIYVNFDNIPVYDGITVLAWNGSWTKYQNFTNINGKYDIGVQGIINKRKVGNLGFYLSAANRLFTSTLQLEIGKTYIVYPKQSLPSNYQFQVNSSPTTQISGGYIRKAFKFTAEAGNNYCVYVRKSDNSSFTDTEMLDVSNNGYIELYEDVSVLLDSGRYVNLFGTAEITDGYFYNYTNGSLTANSDMECSMVDVTPSSDLYFRGRYIQIAFFDDKNVFISGERVDYEANYQDAPSTVFPVPYNAFHAGISCRKASNSDFVITEVHFPSNAVATYKKVMPIPVTQAQVIKQSVNQIYDHKGFVGDMIQNNLVSTGTTSIANGVVALSQTSTIKVVRIPTTLDRMKIGTTVKVTALPSSGVIMRFGTWGSSDFSGVNDCDTFVDVSATNAVLKKGTFNSSVSPTTMGSVTLDEAIGQNDEIQVLIEKDTINHYVCKVLKKNIIIGTIETTATVDPSDADHMTGQMRCWGAPAIGTGADAGAAIEVSRLFQYSDNSQYPEVAVLGDSYVENFSRSNISGWVRLFEEKIGKENIFVAGMGGARTTELLLLAPQELMLCRPQYVVLNVGTNDSNIATDTFKENLLALVEMIKSIDAIPVLTTAPRRGDTDNSTWMGVINPWIKSLGYKYIDLAMALSTGDGMTQDTTRYRPDGVHPNSKGAQAILNYIELNLPELM